MVGGKCEEAADENAAGVGAGMERGREKAEKDGLKCNGTVGARRSHRPQRHRVDPHFVRAAGDKTLRRSPATSHRPFLRLQSKHMVRGDLTGC